MVKFLSRRFGAQLAAALLGIGLAGPSLAGTAYWTVWTAADPANGTATGIITLPDASTVTVTFTALNADGTSGDFLAAFTTANPDWHGWSDFSSDYLSSTVATIPGNTMLQLVGGENETYHVTLSAPIVGPLMDVVSLGANGTNTHYDFNAPFTILSQGGDYWGGCSTCLTQFGNDLIGNEGSGTIQFNGTYSEFDWTVPTGEYWHGFTFGIETTQALQQQQQQNTVPEPGSALLAALALGGMAAAGRMRRR